MGEPSRYRQRNVDTAIRQADIVEKNIDLVIADDLANCCFDLSEYSPGLLDPCPRRSADMQTIRPASTCGKKLIAS